MAERSSILNGENATLREVVVALWLGDGDYGEDIPVYGPVTLEVRTTNISAERFGGGRRLTSMARKTGASATLTLASTSTEAIALITGDSVSSVGATPDRVRSYKVTTGNLPFFGLAAAADLETGAQYGSHVFIPKAQVTADSVIVFNSSGGSDASFTEVSIELTIVEDENFEVDYEDEVQLLTLGSPTAGVYTLGLSGYTTTSIAYGANASAIEDALESLPNIGVGNVTVTTATPSGFNITFIGDRAAQSLPLITATGGALWDGTLAVTRVTRGKRGEAVVAVVSEVEGGYHPSLRPYYVIV